jgi:putative N-acetylmannosamine-6-phosphate epimerase
VTQAAKGGLTRRTIMASALLALVVGGAFAVLVVAIADLRGTSLAVKLPAEGPVLGPDV